MEALLLIAAGLAQAIAALVVGVVTLLFAGVNLIIELWIAGFSRHNVHRQPSLKPEPQTPGPVPKANPSSRQKNTTHKRAIPRWILPVTAILLILAGVLILLAETVLFETALRWISRAQEHKTGVAVSFEEVEGSFLNRHFMFTGVRVRKEGSDQDLQLDFQADHLTADFAGHPLTLPRRMRLLKVENLTGKADIAPPESKKGDGTIHIDMLTGAPAFTIEDLQVQRCRIDIHLPHIDTPVPLVITEWRSSPLRSNRVGFDLLFRSNMEGQFGQAPFSITTSTLQGGRETGWAVQEIPLTTLSAVFGAPWTLLSEGSVDISIEDAWSLEENQAFIDMAWSIRIRDLKIGNASGRPLLTPLTETAFKKFVNANARDGHIDLGFTLRIAEGEITGSVTEALRAIWDAAFTAWAKEKLSLPADQSDRLIEGAKQWGNRLKLQFEKTD